MAWLNLPCAPTLASLAAVCPRGWLELGVEHYPGNPGLAGNHPQDPETYVYVWRVWGIDNDDLQDVLRQVARDELDASELGHGVPHLATVLARVTLRCSHCRGLCNDTRRVCAGRDAGCPGEATVSLVTTWGTGGDPVYWAAYGLPDYAQEPAR